MKGYLDVDCFLPGVALPNEPTVLLALDDEPVNNELLQRAFRPRRNFHILTATSATEALTLLTGQSVDLLIIDYAMPGMSGLEFLAELQRNGVRLPAIMVTAYPEVEAVLRARKDAIIQHIITKPWRSADLLHAVDQVLALSAMRNAVNGLAKS
jgi:adenylate cyclase